MTLKVHCMVTAHDVFNLHQYHREQQAPPPDAVTRVASPRTSADDDNITISANRSKTLNRLQSKEGSKV